jgi:hypothetical protein
MESARLSDSIGLNQPLGLERAPQLRNRDLHRALPGFEFLKRAGMSMVALNAKDTTGPTPGIVIKR